MLQDSRNSHRVGLPPVAATSWNLSAAAWKMGSAFSELMASSMAAVHLSHPSKPARLQGFATIYYLQLNAAQIHVCPCKSALAEQNQRITQQATRLDNRAQASDVMWHVNFQMRQGCIVKPENELQPTILGLPQAADQFFTLDNCCSKADLALGPGGMYTHGWDHVGQLGAAMLSLQPVSLLYNLLQGNLQIIPVCDGGYISLMLRAYLSRYLRMRGPEPGNFSFTAC
ncbi:MAG: hypothetical protein FRX49_04641 [Trebouxia sp. A1-2]|nr:MAG: hypothetical protein FRX49_04641 [Trebouxia sp. A1-2]